MNDATTTDPQTEQEEDIVSSVPSADEMLERLQAVDTQDFDINKALEEEKGENAWIFVMVMPISAIILVLFTLLGTFFTGYFIASFVVTALLLFMIGKIFDQYEQKYRYQARLKIMQRIQETEGDFSLLIHFKDFLPKKYRHLWQSLRKGRYQYIDQYISAINLLQHKLDPEKFKRIWGIHYPEYAIEEDTEDTDET